MASSESKCSRRKVKWADMEDEDQNISEEDLAWKKKIETATIQDVREKLMEIRKQEDWNKRSKEWPRHWKDILHDEDGGNDMFGRGPQDGRALLRSALAKLSNHNGYVFATDDVSGVNLKPELMKEARKLEMKFFKDI